MTPWMLDNGGSQPSTISSGQTPRETLLMAARGVHEDMEAEPVLVAVDGGHATLTLDDGETVDFDLRELRAALEDAA
jgi:hypothetical protein